MFVLSEACQTSPKQKKEKQNRREKRGKECMFFKGQFPFVSQSEIMRSTPVEAK